MPCIFKPDMHHTWMCIVCLAYDGVFTVLFASFRLLLLLASVSFRSCEDSLGYVAPSTSGLVLLPCGIPGKMTIPLDTFTTIAMLSCLDAIVTCRATHLLCQPSPCCHETSNLDTFLAKPLFGYVTRLLSLACSVPLIALLVAGEDEVRSRRELVVGYITISIIII